MKKILMFCVALLFATFASAAEKSVITVTDLSSTGLESTFIVALDNQDKFTAMQINWKLDNVEVKKAVAYGSSKILNDDDEYVYSFTRDFNKFAAFFPAFPEDKREIPTGSVAKITVKIADSSVTGTITLTFEGSGVDAVAHRDFEPIVLTVKEGSITGISNASANADEAAVKANKFMTKKGIVITKGNKKYNAAAQEIK